MKRNMHINWHINNLLNIICKKLLTRETPTRAVVTLLTWSRINSPMKLNNISWRVLPAVTQVAVTSPMMRDSRLGTTKMKYTMRDSRPEVIKMKYMTSTITTKLETTKQETKMISSEINMTIMET